MSDCCASNSEQTSRYDLAVVGNGSAGFSAAITAAEQGAQVALIGHGTIGGTCVNVGCVPSKAMIRATEAVHHANVASSKFAGVEASGAVVDWEALVRQKDVLVTSLREAKYANLLPSYNNVAYIEGRAKLAPEGVEVDGRLVSAGKVIIATGTRPAVPAIPGMTEVPYLTSTTVLELERLPKSLLVLGGGYIGVELAQTLARAGVEVTIIFRSRLLPEAEPEIGIALQGYFADEAIKTVGGVSYRAIRQVGSSIELDVEQAGRDVTLRAEQVLITTGRTPNVEGLGLEALGIETNPGGSIKVDDRLRTTRPGFYAAGDVTGRDQFVYMAAYGAKLAAKNALNSDSLVYDNRAMPAVVFSDPQVGSVGLTEAQARAAGMQVRTSIVTLDHVPRALAARDTRGLIKLVADGQSRKLLGAHILAPEGADSIQTAAMAIRCGLTIDDLAETIFPYLTTVEGLKLAAQTFDKDVSKLSCCAG
ncbi:mercury(II) reductase [Sphingopyxis sp. SE2]|uniref:mercury(II) reductase n=1 Tax=Sphingopyxis sp. SE2 TaxID=1586240 RepID=UPI0028C45174|nr:mercury(II) reductase [Sphingopyxis sp. SE2]